MPIQQVGFLVQEAGGVSCPGLSFSSPLHTGFLPRVSPAPSTISSAAWSVQAWSPSLPPAVAEQNGSCQKKCPSAAGGALLPWSMSCQPGTRLQGTRRLGLPRFQARAFDGRRWHRQGPWHWSIHSALAESGAGVLAGFPGHKELSVRECSPR